MPKPKPPITKRQQQWLDHINAADASEGSLVAYAAAHKLKVKDLYQRKTVLSRRGLLPGKPVRSSFVPVAIPPVAPPATEATGHRNH